MPRKPVPTFRDALAVHMATKLRAAEMLEALFPIIIQHGKPDLIRSDNGSEFVSEIYQSWLERVGIKPIHTYPGSPGGWRIRK